MNDQEMTPRDLIYPKERVYFWTVLFISILSYIFFSVSIIGLPIVLALFFLSFLLHGIMLGRIRTNAVKLTPLQFPEIYNKVEELCGKMGLKKVPEVYVIQSGGIMNAFATRFFRKDMIIVYSEIFELIDEGLDDELYFILAHELAHIKRNHLGKMAFILPSMWIPGVAETYLRACEYTCDRYAAYYSGNPDASKNSLMMLSIGKKLLTHTDQTEFMRQFNSEKGFFVWLSEILSTHPPLPKRIHAIQTFFCHAEPIILPRKNKNWLFGSITFLIVGVFAGFLYYGWNSVESFLSLDDYEDGEVEDVQDVPPITQSVINGDTEKIKILVKAGKDIDEEDYNGYTPMDWAIKAGNTEMVKILLKNGADPNNETSYGMTPIMTAADKGRPEIIKILHSAGADVNYKDSENSMTPLIYAAEGTSEETVKVLLQLGADPNQADFSDMTPYMYAIDVGNDHIAHLLQPKKKDEMKK